MFNNSENIWNTYLFNNISKKWLSAIIHFLARLYYFRKQLLKSSIRMPLNLYPSFLFYFFFLFYSVLHLKYSLTNSLETFSRLVSTRVVNRRSEVTCSRNFSIVCTLNAAIQCAFHVPYNRGCSKIAKTFKSARAQ